MSLLEQHMQLIARWNVSIPAVDQVFTCQAQLFVSETQSRQTDAQLQAIQAKYNKLAAQVSTEEPLLKQLADHSHNQCPILADSIPTSAVLFTPSANAVLTCGRPNQLRLPLRMRSDCNGINALSGQGGLLRQDSRSFFGLPCSVR